MVTKLIEAVYADPRTQIEIAKAAGIQPATLSRILNGKITPQQRTLVRLADALGVDRETLIGMRQKGGAK